MDFFYSVRLDEEKENELFAEVKQKVAAISGCPRFIQFPPDQGGGVAFSGTMNKPDLSLQIRVQRYRKHDEILFYLFFGDEEERFEESNYPSLTDCVDAVCARIASLMNKTVRFIKIQKTHKSLRIIEQILNENGEWVTLNDNIEDFSRAKFMRLFLTKDKYEEKTMTFSI